MIGKFMLMSNLRKTIAVLIGVLVIGWAILPALNKANADQEASLAAFSYQDALPGGHNLPGSIVTVQENSFSSNNSHFTSELKTMYVLITAYSSDVWQTDSTPFITASGSTVRDGIVATNFLPFNTRIRIPELFGDKVFVVEDRMSHEKQYHVDIWFPETSQALDFGAQISYIEILN